MTIATYLHISDLHFGWPENDVVRGALLRFGHHVPLVDGLFGHDSTICRALENFVKPMRISADRQTQWLIDGIITTGDFTSRGAPAFFTLAEQFLDGRGGKADLGGGRRISLSYDRWRAHAIPGNHDHWSPSMPWLADTPQDLPAFCGVRSFPHVSDPMPITPPAGSGCPDGLSLRFIRIDSDVDVNPGRLSGMMNRVMARGAFSSHIDALRAMAKTLPREVPENEVRVLLIHHSYFYTDGLPRTFEMTRRSHNDLHTFLIEYGIRVVLCGHTHKPLVTVRDIGGHEILEACCGTTTRNLKAHKERLPSDMSPLMKRLLRIIRVKRGHHSDLNALILHELVCEDGGLRWQATPHVFSYASGQFEPVYDRADSIVL